MTNRDELELQFHRAMVGIYQRAKTETGYVATRFLQMVSENGGLAASRQLLDTPSASEGFMTLVEKGRLDLTVEAHVLRPEFEPLFTEHELDVARERFRAFGGSGA